MKLCEIFASIQGESTFQGLPTLFVRLAGCNLHCRWCDTGYAHMNGDERTVEDIIAEVERSGLRYVCITGGEPLLQEDTFALVLRLTDLDHVVSVETNGSIDAAPLDSRSHRIIDIKCPGSGEAGSVHRNNLLFPRVTDEYKFVLADREDFDYACETVRHYTLDTVSTILFSTVGEVLSPAQLAAWILEEFPVARLNLQLHKVIWPLDERKR